MRPLRFAMGPSVQRSLRGSWFPIELPSPAQEWE
jgi:hypothetical protein